jgi:hypothetical protein
MGMLNMTYRLEACPITGWDIIHLPPTPFDGYIYMCPKISRRVVIGISSHVFPYRDKLSQRKDVLVEKIRQVENEGNEFRFVIDTRLCEKLGLKLN